ncbi:MarR family winged helix-turn-helix transcriptional regulator [Clostridium saccharoperbutylacetonicum]|uniref:MarR family winged helix-turn-helix transcriptional regulator n=1 Tax=Clostridium saccharoperbutylacetonicum TaxID=36745 RepID=UPI000983922B|nr:MarR family transcriptional regulator [Clostridium saccharoperbutylacetonicum]AQR94447.1 HTH-type transcriptional regulator MgrA [Clostridium saccharoperbutylacetonicum]NSB30150.1 DNA-binding MarR family transcriptional regulator [Clostridium saccharoperbutylacetonicum]
MGNGFESFQVAMLIKEIYSIVMNNIECGLIDSVLTHQQTMVIKLISHKKEITISELCEEMALTKGTVFGIVSRLEDADYVKKVKHNEDKRTTYVIFSDKGKEFAKEYRDVMSNSFKPVFKNFSDEKMIETKKNLLKLREKFKEEK